MSGAFLVLITLPVGNTGLKVTGDATPGGDKMDGSKENIQENSQKVRIMSDEGAEEVETPAGKEKTDAEIIEQQNKINYPENQVGGGDEEDIKPGSDDGKETPDGGNTDIKVGKEDTTPIEEKRYISKMKEKSKNANIKLQRTIVELTKTVGDQGKKLAELTKPKKPVPDDYEDDEQYTDALIDYKLAIKETPKVEPKTKINDEIKDYGDYEDEDEEEAMEMEIKDFRHDVEKNYGKDIAGSVFGKFMTNGLMRKIIMSGSKEGIEYGVYLDSHHSEANKISKSEDPVEVVQHYQAVINKLNLKEKQTTGAPQIIGENIAGKTLKKEDKKKTDEEMIAAANLKNYPNRYKNR